MTDKIKVAVVDDHPIILKGFDTMFANHPYIQLVAQYSMASEFLAYSPQTEYDIALIDVQLPDMNGMELCKKTKEKHPDSILLAMSSQAEHSIVKQMLRNGASGYMLKTAEVSEWEECIVGAINGATVFSNEIKSQFSSLDMAEEKIFPRFTQREKEIIQLITVGKSTQEIADTLFISFLTVQTHRRNILQKLEVKNTAELIHIINTNRLLY